MASKIFDHISLEDLEESRVIENNENYTDDVLALDNQFRGIQFAAEQIDYLSRLKNILVKNKTTGLSKAGKVLTATALENITTRLDINTTGVLSMESLDTPESVNVAIESITDTIKNIWKSIVETLKYIWNKIKAFFSSDKRRAADNVSVVKRHEQEIKSLVSEMKKLEVVVPEKATVQNVSLVEPLKYLNKNISQNELLELPVGINNISKFINELILEVEKAHTTVFMNIDAIKEEDSDAYVNFCKTSTEESNFSLYNSFNTYVQSLPSINSDDKIHKEKLNSDMENGDTVDSTSVKNIDGFIHNGTCMFYTLANKNKGRIQMKCYDQFESNNSFVTIPIPDLDNVEMYASRVATLSRSLFDISETYNDKFKYLDSVCENIYKGMFVRIQNIDENNEDQIKISTVAVVEVSKYLNILSTETVKTYSMFQRSVQYHSALLKYFRDHYNTINEQGKS